MKLKDVIHNCNTYEDNDDVVFCVFAKRVNGSFIPNSEAIVLELTTEEVAMNISEIAKSKCPELEYFLEFYIIQDIYNDLLKVEDYKLDDKKIERIINYAEFDA